MKHFILLILVILSGKVYAQQEASKLPVRVFTKVEQPAQFPGGEQALQKYFSENLKQPETRKEQTVVTTFIVNETGVIQDVQVLKPRKKELNEEAVRVIQNMPAWTPAMQNGRAVAYKVELPVVFNAQKQQ
ncbi:TonB family protein [Dyadobacter sp.]|uniref:TonB family protein n=1 Tax=Dyadobacter sp. TaxID=1914288 RepID=UPI003F711EFA